MSIPGDPALSAELTALLGVPPTPALPASPQTPIFHLGFGNPYLINNDFRVAYADDAAGNPDGAVPTPRRACPAPRSSRRSVCGRTCG